MSRERPMDGGEPTAGAERALELLADRALEGLDENAALELEALLRGHPELDDESLDRTAAALLVAAPGLHAEPMPDTLRRLCEESGRRWSMARPHRPQRVRGDDRAMVGDGPPSRAPGAASGARGGPRLARRAPVLVGPLGWLATAAAVAIAALAWWPDLRVDRGGEEAPATERRGALLARAPDVLRWAWSPPAHERCAADGGGDVAWSNGAQEGYLRIGGLAPNDPARWQYQLWIFDASRDERYPVDGGVFDVGTTGEIVVPIHAALPVREPVAFAVTVEPPGGVVVSQRDVVLMAARP